MNLNIKNEEIKKFLYEILQIPYAKNFNNLNSKSSFVINNL